jgi:hypothetical protein
VQQVGMIMWSLRLGAHRCPRVREGLSDSRNERGPPGLRPPGRRSRDRVQDVRHGGGRPCAERLILTALRRGRDRRVRMRRHRNLHRMEADPGLAVVAARRHMIDESSRVLVPGRGLSGLTGLHSNVEVARRVVRSGVNPIGEPGGVLFRRADYDFVGGWNPQRPYTMDLDLWMRLLRCGEFVGLRETLAAFRIGRQSMTVANEAAIYAAQKAIMAELVASPQFDVRPIDRAIGRLHAPLGRLRRRLLFYSANRGGGRDEDQPAALASDTGGGRCAAARTTPTA